MMTRRSARSGFSYEDRYGFSRAVRVGDRIEVAGTAPIPPDGEPVAPTAYEQMLRCGDIAALALAELGARTDDVVRTRMFITDPSDADEIGRAHREVFGNADRRLLEATPLNGLGPVVLAPVSRSVLPLDRNG